MKATRGQAQPGLASGTAPGQDALKPHQRIQYNMLAWKHQPLHNNSTSKRSLIQPQADAQRPHHLSLHAVTPAECVPHRSPPCLIEQRATTSNGKYASYATHGTLTIANTTQLCSA